MKFYSEREATKTQTELLVHSMTDRLEEPIGVRASREQKRDDGFLVGKAPVLPDHGS